MNAETPNNNPKNNSKQKVFEDIKDILKKSSKSLEKIEKILRDQKIANDKKEKGETTGDKVAKGETTQAVNNQAKKMPPAGRPFPALPPPVQKVDNWQVVDDLPSVIGNGGAPPGKPPIGKRGGGIGGMMRGVGSAVMSRLPILAGGMLADTALGAMGVGDEKVTGYMEHQDEANWKRMSFFEKAQSGFARGVEKVGNVIGMDNVSNAARHKRIQNEMAYFKAKDEAEPQDVPIINTPQPTKGLAQVLDEQDAERKKAAEVGPPRALFEQKRAEENQAADYKAAGETMAAAGYTTVTGRGALNPGAKEMEPADFEQAQQAQAAREAVGRGLRQRKRNEASEINPEQNKPSIFSKIGSSVTNLKNKIEFAYNRGVSETPGDQEVNRRMEEIISAREKEGNPLEEYSQEYNDISNKIRKEIESKNPNAFVQAEQKIGAKTEINTSSSQSGDRYSHLQTRDSATTSSKSLFGSEFLGGLATKKGLSKEFSIGSSHVSRDQNGERSEEFSNIIADRVSGGFFGRDKYKVTLDGEDVDVDKQYYRQIKSLLDAGKPKEAAAVARHIRDQQSPISLKSPEETVTPMSASASSLPSALNQLSTENRDLSRESTNTASQPVVINNNTTTGSQNYVPLQAQPRLHSSFSRYQERSAAF